MIVMSAFEKSWVGGRAETNEGVSGLARKYSNYNGQRPVNERLSFKMSATIN